VVADVLRHLEHEADLMVCHLQSAQNVRQLALKVDIHHGTDDLYRREGRV
jgi:hypothetical protein